MKTNGKKNLRWILLSILILSAVLFASYQAAQAATPRYVDPTGTDSGDCSSSACLTLGYAISQASPGDTINVAAGSYTENVVIGKALTIVGAGIGSTVIYPATSNPNPCSGSSLCGGSITGSSNVFGIQASDVTIQDLTIDGDNPSLTSGIVRDGADLDARNGIITDHTLSVTYNNLEVHHVEVKNIYLRGMYASSGGTFNFHHNTVTNVQGDNGSIGIFAWYGPGTMANNTVSYANDAISANHSKGIQFLNNTVTHSGSGVHTDNAGDSSGSVADLIQGNTVSDCATDGYGVWVFVPYIAPSVTENTVTGCAVGLSAWGQGAAVNTVFSKNVVNGPAKAAGSVGVYITTDLISWGYRDITVTFQNNVISNNETGIYFTADPQTWNSDPYTSQTITATFANNDLSGNTLAADMGTQGTYNLDASGNWWGVITPADVKAAVNGGSGIDYTPWLAAGSDTSSDPGFQGNFAGLGVDDDSPQTGTTGRIQEAIGLVSGSTINVAAGLYDERLVIDKSLVLKGATHGVSKKGYVVPSGYAYDPAVESIIRPSTPLEQAVIEIKSDNVVIDGFVVAYEVAQTGGVYQDLINLNQYTSVTTGIQVINNVLGPNTNTASQDGTKGRSGFTILGPRTIPVKNLVIEDNKIFDAKGNGCGIMIVATYSPEYHGGSGTGYMDMSGGRIENNEITGIHRSGIELAGGVSGETPGGFVIKDNTITNNGFGGTADAANIKFGNGITMIRGGGDKAKANPSGSRYITFENNTISGNEKNGIYAGSQNHDLVLIGNDFTGNGAGTGGYSTWDGIRIDLDEAYYTGHTIRYDILAHIAANRNNIYGNGGLGINVIQTPTQGPVNAEYNWWGAACGPAGSGGDGVSANVDYTPWWTQMDGPGTSYLGSGGELIFTAGSTTASMQAILACAAPYSTILYESGSYPGGLVVNTNGLTINLNSLTVRPGSPAYTINADDVTVLGPGILDGASSTSPAILVNAGADNFMLQDVQVKGWADGVEVAGSVTSLKLISNWIHSNTDAGLQIDTGAVVDGIVTIEGNLFKVNGGNGIQNNGASGLKAEYNSWGDVGGPAGTLGDGISANVDADPWTFSEVYMDMDPGTIGDQYQRNVYETQPINVSLNLEAANLFGVSFKFTYDPTLLNLTSTNFASPWAGKCTTLSTTAGEVAYRCNLTSTPDWDGGTLVTFGMTPTGSGLTGNGPWQALFNLAHLEASTSSGAIGGVKVFVNNAGFNSPSTANRDITDANDGQLDITGIAKFTGYIDLQGRGNDSGALIKVYNAATGTTVFAQGTSSSSGSYQTNYVGSNVLQVGTTYWFFVDRDLYLPTYIPGGPWNPNDVLTSRPNTSLATLVLLGGDATNNNLIDTDDASCIGSAYGGTLNTCDGVGANSDVNGDGKIDIYDLVLMGGNYTLTYSNWSMP
jgi:hypothetical protein